MAFSNHYSHKRYCFQTGFPKQLPICHWSPQTHGIGQVNVTVSLAFFESTTEPQQLQTHKIHFNIETKYKNVSFKAIKISHCCTSE